MKEQEEFLQFGFSDETLKAIAKKGFESPTPIQQLVIPVLMSENIDVIGQAQTEPGKLLHLGFQYWRIFN